jgi:hypothetical protein
VKTLSFLAGLATGLLLNRWMSTGSAAVRQPPAGRDIGTGDTTASDDFYPMRSKARSDDEVRERIQSQLGRTIANPEAVQVDVREGCVTLSGRVQAADSVLLMAEVESTTGVTEVRNQLEIEGSLDEVAPPMTRDRPSIRAGERASSRMS